MRKAEVDRAWERCRDPDRRRLAVAEIAFPDGEGFNRLVVSSRVSAFIGKNGAGKTSLLRALCQLLESEVEPNQRIVVESLSGRYNGHEFRVPRVADGAGMTPAAIFVDTSAQAHKLLDFFGAQKDLAELLASYGFKRNTQNESVPFNFLCGRSYDHIEVAEVEGPVPAHAVVAEGVDPDVLPFFKLSYGGVEYDTLSMGFGELCAFYIVWTLNRVPRGSIVLFDEPDSHLSPVARRALSSVIAMIASERELWVGFTSHSTEALEALDDSELYLVDPDGAGSSPAVSLAGARRRALRALGIAPVKRLLVAVEDVDAEEVALQILNKFADEVAGAVDIQKLVAGAADVVRFVDAFPAHSQMGRSVALLDGDKRVDFATNRNVLFLPGTSDPIAMARRVVATEPTQFAAHLGISVERLIAAVRTVQAVDHHDFCSALLEELRLEGNRVHEVRRALILAWLSDNATALEAGRLAASIVELVDNLPFLDWRRERATA